MLSCQTSTFATLSCLTFWEKFADRFGSLNLPFQNKSLPCLGTLVQYAILQGSNTSPTTHVVYVRHLTQTMKHRYAENKGVRVPGMRMFGVRYWHCLGTVVEREKTQKMSETERRESKLHCRREISRRFQLVEERLVAVNRSHQSASHWELNRSISDICCILLLKQSDNLQFQTPSFSLLLCSPLSCFYFTYS